MSTVEITGIVKAVTDKAFLFNDSEIEVWIPYSQVSDYNEDDIQDFFDTKEETTIEIPEWLAIEKEFI